MKIIIKNLKQVTYIVEINSEKLTILDLKKEIEKSHGFDSTTLKLLFNGVVLDDSKTLEEYKIKDESTIIMMNSRVKPKNIQQPPSNTDLNQPKKEEKKTEELKPGEKKANEPKKAEEKYSQQINSLIDMGFEKSQAEAAIKAARGQIDLAVDFLYNGIPEGINDIAMGEEGNNDNDVNDENEEDPIKTIASVAKILCQNNPGALNELLQTIQQTNPDLMDLLKERENEFKTLLEQPINEQDYRAFQRFGNQMGIGGEGGEDAHHSYGGGQRKIRLNLTPEEQEAIKRLKDSGNFSEADVIQAYIACDKNEELTANYLFEQKMKDDDEMSGGNKNNNSNNNNAGNGQ